jgi:hypothetical protein
MIERKEFVKFKFEYTDDFNQKYKFQTNLDVCNIDDTGEFELSVEQFKRFLLAQGYAQKTVDKIQLIED